ncbi:MAG: hypothetical protein IPJ41_00630 [Phycisphaerales bacterium]|nr:hypothetical protein [Phycisphaerales bacterium]
MYGYGFATALGFACSVACADTYNLQSDWSDTSNPSGVWSLNEGSNPLPHVDSWQRNLGGWSSAQPAWAESEDGSNRIPMFFMSNGTESFGHDWAEGQTVAHITDGFNGQGNGPATLAFTAPASGTLSVHGGLWMGRDIGRSMTWTLLLNGSALTAGTLASGDPYSSADPFDFGAGSGGQGAVENLPVHLGDRLELRFDKTSDAGDFVVIDMTVDLDRCRGDFNGDGNVNTLDVLAFLNAWAVGDSSADFNGDGNVNTLDVLAFLNAWATGC